LESNVKTLLALELPAVARYAPLPSPVRPGPQGRFGPATTPDKVNGSPSPLALAGSTPAALAGSTPLANPPRAGTVREKLGDTLTITGNVHPRPNGDFEVRPRTVNVNEALESGERDAVASTLSGRTTLVIAENMNGELRAELADWPAGADLDRDPPDRCEFGPLTRLASTLKRRGVTAAGVTRLLIQAGAPMRTINKACEALA
jgi:hypothetical protein